MSANKVYGQGDVMQYVCVVKQDAEFFIKIMLTQCNPAAPYYHPPTHFPQNLTFIHVSRLGLLTVTIHSHAG